MRWFAFEHLGRNYFLSLNMPELLNRAAYWEAVLAAKRFTERACLQVSLLHEKPLLPSKQVYADNEVTIYLRTKSETEAAA